MNCMVCIIIGKKFLQFDDLVVVVDNLAWLIFEISDGKVVRIYFLEFIYLVGLEWEVFIVLDFLGMMLIILLIENNGKLFDDDDQIFVEVNGLFSYIGVYWIFVCNVGAILDVIEFIGVKVNDCISVCFLWLV